VCTELFPSNGCCTGPYLHSCYLGNGSTYHKFLRNLGSSPELHGVATQKTVRFTVNLKSNTVKKCVPNREINLFLNAHDISHLEALKILILIYFVFVNSNKINVCLRFWKVEGHI
jgi:hypothetical protein